MGRAIDSEQAYKFLTDQLMKETGAFSKGVNKGLNIARSAMRNPDAIPTLPQPGNEALTRWVSVKDKLPELPERDWCSKMVISCDKNGHVAPMTWERAQVRGKTIDRWKYHWDKIYDGAGITHWMPLPEPPYRRPPEGENEP